MAGVLARWIRPLCAAPTALALASAMAGAQADAGISGGPRADSASHSQSAAPSGTPTGVLTGRLTDSYSTPLVGATVILHNQATGAEARTTTLKNGAYRLNGLEAGEYTLEADSPKLGRGRVESIFVSAGHEARVQAAIVLELPRHAPTQAALHEMSPAAAAVSTTLPAEEMQKLPLTGRRWQDFVLDTPAASSSASADPQTSFRGMGQAAAGVLLDGASRTPAFGATNAASESGTMQNEASSAWAQGRGATLGAPAMSQIAIREVQLASGNAEAEAGRAAAGAMNLESSRGTDKLHGQAFFFDRQNSWGAQNPFTQWVRETAPAVLTYNPAGPPLSVPVFTPEPYTPPDREQTFGAGVGGRVLPFAPAWRDKLFWFAALDGYLRNDPGLSTVKHPDQFFATPPYCDLQVLSARLGLTGQGSPKECVSGLVAGLTAYSSILETLAGLLGPAPRTATQSVAFGRIDWQAAERHHFTFEGIGALWNSPGGGLTRTSETYGNRSFGASHANESWTLARWESFLTPNLLAVTQGSWGRDVLSTRPETPSPFEQSFLNGNAWGQLPQIAVDSRYGFTIGNPARFGAGDYPDERLYQAQEMVDWVHRGLLVKAGFEVRHNADATSLLRNQTGTYHYSTLENFASDALAFGAFGLNDALDPANPHNCDQTGKVWRDTAGKLRGLGNLPCYSSYTQTMGPNEWKLSTNDWASFVTTQWEPSKLLVFSAGVRWEREQLPPPISGVVNPALPLTARLPSLGNNWGPRAALAFGVAESHWPVLRLGYGMYFARTDNATVETALTQTGSQNGDLNFFMRPTDDQQGYPGGAPPFPYVLQGEPINEVRPGAVEFASGFRNPEVHQAVAALEETLPGGVRVTASALASLGRRLPLTMDTNIDLKAVGTITYDVCDPTPPAPGAVATECAFTGMGPIKTPQLTVPFYASWPSANSTFGFGGRLNPNYQQVLAMIDRANSTYEAAVLRIDRFGRRGLSLHAHYTYSHATDWNPGETPLSPDPADFRQEYGTSDLDQRHSAGILAVFEPPWHIHARTGNGSRNWAAQAVNGWALSGIGHYGSGLPYTMRVEGSLPQCVVSSGITSCTPPQTGVNATVGEAFVGLLPGINGSGGANRVYGLGNGAIPYNIGRNTFRYPPTWKADLRLSKSIDLGGMRQLELLAESFNLFNHQNVTELETTGYYIESGTASSPPTLNFLTGLEPNSTAFGQPLNINATNFYRERQIQLGLRLRF